MCSLAAHRPQAQGRLCSGALGHLRQLEGAYGAWHEQAMQVCACHLPQCSGAGPHRPRPLLGAQVRASQAGPAGSSRGEPRVWAHQAPAVSCPSR